MIKKRPKPTKIPLLPPLPICPSRLRRSHHRDPHGLRRLLCRRRRQVALPGAPQVPQEAVGDHGPLRLDRVPQRASGRGRVPHQVPGHRARRLRQGHRAHLRPGDRLRNQVLHPRPPPVRRTLLRKPDLERYMAAKQFDPVKDFPQPYVNTTVEEDDNTIGGGYQK
jgi:hypothetical protein